MQKVKIFLSATLVTVSLMVYSQEPNYDESKVPAYSLPDPLKMNDGRMVSDAEMWTRIRRPEILEIFRKEVYGKSPGQPAQLRFSITDEDRKALNGVAIRKQITIHLGPTNDDPKINLLMYLPAGRQKSPVFLGLNYYGNQTVHPDPAIHMSTSWMRDNKDFGIVNNRATEASRGVRVSRWPIEEILENGYGVVTAYYGDIDPDFDDGFQNGVHKLYKKQNPERSADEWASIAAWAWGLSRAMDYLEIDKDVDANRVAVVGHSRLGKAALWAGAEDQRFAMVISNDSGCGGAALSKRAYGETVARINTAFPHWFAKNFSKYNNNEDRMPFDQHMLLALVAPRPLYVASAEEDRWADPKGEFLSAVHATPVYKLFGKEGLPTERMPSIHEPVMGTVGYHIRAGKHDVTDYDWRQFMIFADKHFSTKEETRQR